MIGCPASAGAGGAIEGERVTAFAREFGTVSHFFTSKLCRGRAAERRLRFSDGHRSPAGISGPR
jgi:hypothetical protein